MSFCSLSRLFFVLFFAFTLSACGGGGDGDEQPTTPTPVVETFTVSLSQESLSITQGENVDFSYTITREGSDNFDVQVRLTSEPDVGTVSIDADNNRVNFTSEETGSGSFSLTFSSASLQINRQIVYSVTSSNTDPDPVDPPSGNSQEYIIFMPSDHITIFEGESITLDLERNYEINDQIVEEFYFNVDNVEGRISADKKTMTLTARDAEEDTYGEVTAVTSVNGELHESKMYVIYFNKNRDLQTTEAPVIALLEHEIRVAPYASTVKTFDVFDPDSDRISYRVLSSPSFANTHVAKVDGGYELTIHTIGEIDPDDNDVVLEVSDAHNVDVHTFNLIKDTSKSNRVNQAPVLSIEENVTVSLIKQFQGNETGLIAELAFVASDPDGDVISYSASSSAKDKYSFNIQYPYLYVRANDISDLQYDQITLIASDGRFDTKLTFHFYIQNNFATFMGGNPNTAPMTNLPTELKLLEGQRYEIPFNSFDSENHPFDVGIATESDIVDATLTDTHLVLTASTPNTTTESSITIWLEDVFEARREHTIKLTVAKNSAPQLTLDFVDTPGEDKAPYKINEVEQTAVKVNVTATDVDQDTITPEFTFNDNFITLVYEDGVATINSVDITSDYKGDIVISATDEFDVRTEKTIGVTYRFRDPNNQFPNIAIAQEAFTLQPGESGSTTITVTDPESDPLEISASKDSDDITFTYNIATGKIDFEVADDAANEQELKITITASDGLGQAQKDIIITVPKSPTAPELTIDFYERDVPEEEQLVITFSATDSNEEALTVSTVIPAGTDLSTNLILTEQRNGFVRGYVEVTPPKNVLSPQELYFNLNVTDASAKVDSEAVILNVQPVNDPPEIEFVVLDGLTPGASGEIILSNETPVTLSYGIKDPDTTGQTVQVIYPVKTGTYEVSPGNDKPYQYFIQSTVTASDNEISINGNSKADVFGYVSANKGSLAVNGDTHSDTINVQVQEPISAGSGSNHGDDLDVNVTIKFVNDKPVVAAFDLIQLLENQTQTINLDITDGNIADRTSLSAGDEELCITISNTSTVLQLYDVRPAAPELINLGTAYCDTDARGPLTSVRIDTSAVTADESEFFTINVTDGFENVTQIVNVEVINN